MPKRVREILPILRQLGASVEAPTGGGSHYKVRGPGQTRPFILPCGNGENTELGDEYPSRPALARRRELVAAARALPHAVPRGAGGTTVAAADGGPGVSRSPAGSPAGAPERGDPGTPRPESPPSARWKSRQIGPLRRSQHASQAECRRFESVSPLRKSGRKVMFCGLPSRSIPGEIPGQPIAVALRLAPVPRAR